MSNKSNVILGLDFGYYLLMVWYGAYRTIIDKQMDLF